MCALLLALASFLGGILLGAGSYRARSALADLRAALPGPLAPAWLPRCANIYAGRCTLASDPHRGALGMQCCRRLSCRCRRPDLWLAAHAPGAMLNLGDHCPSRPQAGR